MTLFRIFAALTLAALPLSAAVREHAIRPFPAVTVTGVVRDAAGNPVPGAIVTSGKFSSNGNGTVADGKYSITLPGGRPTLFTVNDFAFDPEAVVFTPAQGATLDVTMTKPRPAVTVKLTSGETHVLDLGTSQFAYYVPLSGYARFDNANLCKPDGSSFAPSKTEIAKIVGPPTSVNFSPCCSRGPLLAINVQLKTGETSQMYMTDSCFDDELDFIGRERTSGQWQYMKFTDIAEIDFP